MEQLGLGVRLDLDDNMSREINPIIRDLERLRAQANRTSTTMDSMRNTYDPFGRNRRQNIRDYHDSMQSMDRVLLNISDRLITATNSANRLGRALNRTQFGGNFNRMYSDMMRVQRMLGNMGFGMSKLQREMSNLKAFNMMDVQIKDLHDRIKLTDKALKEMQNSPDASKYVKEMDVAKRALQAYRSELTRVGSLQQKLADTHGLGITKNNAMGKDVLYERENDPYKNIKNQLTGAMMTDMALASTVAYKSLSRTSDMLTGVGHTALDAKQKLAQYAGQLQATGTILSTTVSLVSALAMGVAGYTAYQVEKPQANYQAQTLQTTQQARPYQNAMLGTWATSSGAKLDDSARMYSTLHNSGITKEKDMNQIAGGAWEISYAQGTDALETMNSIMGIAKTTGSSYSESLDILSVALKQTNGDLDTATELALANAGAFKDAGGEWKNAFETLNTANDTGAMERLIQGGKTLILVFEKLWTYGLKDLVGGLGDLISKMGVATSTFLENHQAIAKVLGMLTGLVLVVGLLAGPIMLVTGFLLRFRSVIQGVALSATALNKGGLALLGAQSNMVAKGIHGATVAFARFPQTLMLAVLPAIYNITRAIPTMLWNMMKLNPVMTALTFGIIAYSKNWFGFGDTVRNITGNIKQSWGEINGVIGKGLNGVDISADFSKLSSAEQAITKIMGTAKIAKTVLGSIFSGKELKFSAGEQNLLKQLGIEEAVDKIAKVGRGVKDFFDGFIDGIELVYSKFKTFAGWMTDTFEPIIVRISNFISKLFGGSGDAKSIEDIMKSANGANETMSNLGKFAGIALASLLGFKLVKPLLGGMFKNLIKNPFAGIISSANNARRAISNVASVPVRNLASVARNVASVATRGSISSTTRTRDTRGRMSTSGQGGLGIISRRGRDFANASNRQGLADRNNLGVTHRQYQAMSAGERNAHNRRLVATRASARGYNLDRDYTRANQGRGGSEFINNRVAGQAGTRAGLGSYQRGQLRAIHERGAIQGTRVYARRQNVVSRALLGQAYDRFDEQGRRRTVNRTGGLLRRRSADLRVTDSLGVRDRVSQSVVRGTDRARAGIRNATGALGRTAPVTYARAQAQRATGAVRSAGSAVANSRALKPITVPVRYAMERLRTAGIIRQGTQSGRQSGNLFKRAFNTATRGLKAGYSGVSRGASSAGRLAGKGFTKGFGAVKMGAGALLRIIPILGWAIMAWDIVKTIFTNWDAIKAGAMNAWNWIKDNGMTTLQSAWESIKEYAGIAWDWILSDGLRIFGDIAVSVISFLGDAFVWVMGKAGEVLAWVWTDGIEMAMGLGADILKWLGQAFVDLIPWALGKLGELASSVGEVAGRIGTAILNGIKGALAGLGGWISDQIAKVPGGSWVLDKLGVGGGKDPKKHARGGIINAPHLGLVGEAGPEAIIPLSGNQRNRAQMLMQRVAGTLGMSVQKQTPNDTDINNFVSDAGAPVIARQNSVVRNSSKGNAGIGTTGSEDNSITINAVHINVPQGQKVDSTTGKGIARTLAKELQGLMKQERLRSKGKNLTLEELILNM